MLQGCQRATKATGSSGKGSSFARKPATASARCEQLPVAELMLVDAIGPGHGNMIRAGHHLPFESMMQTLAFAAIVSNFSPLLLRCQIVSIAYQAIAPPVQRLLALTAFEALQHHLLVVLQYVFQFLGPVQRGVVFDRQCRRLVVSNEKDRSNRRRRHHNPATAAAPAGYPGMFPAGCYQAP